MLDLAALAAIADRHRDELADSGAARDLTIGGRAFRFSQRPHVMGVINLSRDSWYRESVCLSAEQAVRRGGVLTAQGADLVDIGAESTLAHAERADAGRQRSLLLPVVEELSARGVVVSVETYRPEVTSACLEAGAAVLNLTGTADLEAHLRVVADHGAAAILCYVQGENVREVGDLRVAEDMAAARYEFFARQVEVAERCGVEQLLIDPGLGFYYGNLQDSRERVVHQMATFLETFRLRRLGWPTCHALPHAFEYFGEEVRSAEAMFAVLALIGRTDLLRTHEVPRVKAVVDTLAEW